MKQLSCLLCLAFLSLSAADARAVTIPTVPVGNPGNAGDTTEVMNDGTSDYGAVAYNYRIGTTEVTNAQYAAFLNEKAKSDPLGLYPPLSGITQSGISPNFSYAPKTIMGDKPVNWVSWYDAIRFANWLHNGQGSGDTETGAYTLLGGTPEPSNGLSITRNAGAQWWLPSENEWYKAAYYQPAAQGGDSDNYWLYPTRSNDAPTIAIADSVNNISNPGANVANYFQYDWWNNNLTTVSSAGPLSESFYGTSDQGGNVYEWNEALIGSSRCVRGGSCVDSAGDLRSNVRNGFNGPTSENERFGFRVATVPEPGDVNFDGVVDIFDVNLVSAHWGESGPVADANADMMVDIFDINLISANWTSGGGATAVPEPQSLVLGAVGLTCLLLGRWQRSERQGQHSWFK